MGDHGRIELDGGALPDLSDAGQRRHLAEFAREVPVQRPGAVLRRVPPIGPGETQTPALGLAAGVAQALDRNGDLDHPTVFMDLAGGIPDAVPILEAGSYNFV